MFGNFFEQKPVKYNDISIIGSLLRDKKKILLAGEVGSGKSYTLKLLKEKYDNEDFIYFDNDGCDLNEYYEEMKKENAFLNSSKGTIATVQGTDEELVLHEFVEKIGESEHEVKRKLDYIIMINNGYMIFDAKNI